MGMNSLIYLISFW